MSVRGNLQTMELEGLLQWVAQGRKSGTLVVKNSRDEKRLVFEDGDVVSTFSTNPHEHVCRFLHDRQLVDRDRLREALQDNRGNSLQLGRALVESGDLREEILVEVLELRAEETVRDLFEWPDGDFQFLQDELPAGLPVRISLEVTALLLRVADRIDRLRKAAATGSPSGSPSRPSTRGQLALVVEPEPMPAAPQPISDPMPAIEPDPRPATAVATAESGESAVDSNRFLLIAGVGAFLFAAAIAFFLLRPDGADAPVAADDAPIAPVIAEVGEVDQLEARIAELQTQMSDLLEQREETIGEKARTDYERAIARLESELAAAKVEESAKEAAVDPVPVAESVPADSAPPSPQAPSRPLGVTSVVADMKPMETESASIEETPAGEGERGVVEAAAPVQKIPTLPEPVEPAPAVSVASVEASRPAGEVPIVAPGPGVVGPTIVRQARPKYPPLAQRMRREASVQLEVLVGTDGVPEQVRRVGSEVGLGFDAAAMSAARRTQWTAPTAQGKPARMWATLRIDFRNP